MKLFHGTSQSNSASILVNGLKPRSILGTKGMWAKDHNAPSSSELVYLSSNEITAWFFAVRAALITASDPVLLEIDITEDEYSNMYPDENFYVKGWIAADQLRAAQVQAAQHQEDWKACLSTRYLVAHKGPISPNKIAFYDHRNVLKTPYRGFVSEWPEQTIDAFDKSFNLLLDASDNGFFSMVGATDDLSFYESFVVTPIDDRTFKLSALGKMLVIKYAAPVTTQYQA